MLTLIRTEEITNMPLEYAIRTAIDGPGYRIVRVADQTTLATFTTYGEASRNLDAVGRADQGLPPAPTPERWHDPDEPRCTLVDDGERSGVRLERYDRPSGESGWLDFRVGHVPGKLAERVMVSVYLYGGTRQGIDLVIGNNSINERLEEVWTLADLRRLRDDLDLLLADPRLAGALAEQTAQPALPKAA